MGDDFKLSTTNRIIILTAVIASLLEIIDSSIVNVAIPTMMGNLGATLEDVSWVVTGYIIANAIVLPIAGWLGMQMGRKTYYVGAILIFTLTSVLCGLAPNLPTLVIFRILQGLAGGALLPTSQALIQEQFPQEKAGIASAIYGMGVMVGPTIGPTLGGYLTDNFGWRSIFNINLPLGLLAAGLAYWKVEDMPAKVDASHAVEVAENAGTVPQAPAKKKRPSIDLIGLTLLAVGIGCFQFVLERGQADEWFDSNAIRATAVLAALAIPALIWWELKIKNPILDLRLFKHSAVRNGTLLMMALGMMLYSIVFIVPVFVSSLLGYTAMQTGMLYIPGALITGALMPFIGGLLRKHDPRILIFIGICIVEVALFMMTRFTAQAGGSNFFIPLFVRGIGMAFLFVPINTVVLGQFSGQELGQVAGMMNLFRQIGGSIGIAGLSTLLDRHNAQNLVDLLNNVTLLNPSTYTTYMQSIHGMSLRVNKFVGFTTSKSAALQTLTFRVQKQVLVMSFNQMMWTLVVGFSLAFIPLFLMKITKKIKGPVDAH